MSYLGTTTSILVCCSVAFVAPCPGALSGRAEQPRAWAKPPSTTKSQRVAKLVELSTKNPSVYRSGIWEKNPLQPKDVPEAVKYIEAHADHSSHLLLMVLRVYHPAAYRKLPNLAKAQVLCSELKEVGDMNDWTPPFAGAGETENDPGRALIQTGKDSVNALSAMLDDNRPARMSGSESAMISQEYQFRRKDYAYRYLSIILGSTYTCCATDPQIRDKHINELKKKMKSESK